MIEKGIEPLLKLWLIPKFGLRGLHKILKTCKRLDDLVNVFKLSPLELQNNYQISTSEAFNIYQNRSDDLLDEELKLANKYDVNIISLWNEYYPPFLRQIDFAPPILYYKGDISFDYKNSISMVGTRRASIYGVSQTISIIEGLNNLGGNITTVSGLALGIDTVVHKHSIKNRFKTIAVLANGLASIYPRQNIDLAKNILENGGALISEVNIKSAPLVYNFPLRNRIISGLTPLTVVTEAGIKSGALITARYAFEQNRELFVLPGKVDIESYQGNLALLKKNMAQVITSANDLLSSLNFSAKRPAKSLINSIENIGEKKLSDSVIKNLSPEDLCIYNYLEQKVSSLEEICNKLNLDSSLVLSTLARFEIDNIVENKAGLYKVNDDFLINSSNKQS